MGEIWETDKLKQTNYPQKTAFFHLKSLFLPILATPNTFLTKPSYMEIENFIFYRWVKFGKQDKLKHTNYRQKQVFFF